MDEFSACGGWILLLSVLLFAADDGNLLGLFFDACLTLEKDHRAEVFKKFRRKP